MVFYRVSYIILFLLCIPVISLPPYRIDLEDKEVFEITSDNLDYNEDNENEMIQPADLVGLESLLVDDSKYKPLHSFVEVYNRAAEKKSQLSNAFSYLQPNIRESYNIEKREPFYAGFKEELDKKHKSRMKRDDDDYSLQTTTGKDTDFFKMIIPQIPSGLETTENTETTFESFHEYEGVQTPAPPEIIIREESTTEEIDRDEEVYDYEKFKLEYAEQIAEDISVNRTLNYTDKEESEENPKEAIKALLELQSENCTQPSKRVGVKAIDCWIQNYERGKNPAVKKTLTKMWLLIKVWFFVYVGLAIPCWCQKGWCCCCFRCKLCFPRKTILFAKQYYILNPPGILINQQKRDETIRYEPTIFEEDAYESFETAIRNI